MTRHRLAVAAGVALLSVAAAAAAHEYTLGALKIGHPWSLPTPPGAPTAAGYLTITNNGAKPDRLLGGETPMAAKIEIHSMSMTGNIMRMREVAGGLAIAPGQTVKFDPSDYHLMLIGPKRPFKVGDHIPATLRFAGAGEVKVEFYVQAEAPKSDAMGGMTMH